VVIVTAAFLRLYELDLMPLHHDEGLNGHFLTILVRNGIYQYDPEHYHGPTLCYFSALIPWSYRLLGGVELQNAQGLTTFNIRLVTAAFGVGTVGLVFLLRSRLGSIGSLSAAGLIAISSGAVYFSRHFIHESLFVCFTLGIVVAVLRYFNSRQPLYLILAGVSAGLMCATKETWIITGPVLLISFVSTNLHFWLRRLLSGGKERSREERLDLPGRYRFLMDRLGGPASVLIAAVLSLTSLVIVFILFYSSFLTNYPKGLSDALSAVFSFHRVVRLEHPHPWWQYIVWLYQEESPILILAGAGALLAFWRADNRLALFVAQWAFGLLAAHSLVVYKTPWIVLNFIVPLAITSGYVCEAGYQKLRKIGRPHLLSIMGVLLTAICGYQMISLNFFHYDDETHEYVYGQTSRNLLVMLDEIDSIAKANGTGANTGIAILSHDYWPLPWYLRDYKRVAYYGQIARTNEPIIITSREQAEDIEALFGSRYVIKSLAPATVASH